MSEKKECCGGHACKTESGHKLEVLNEEVYDAPTDEQEQELEKRFFLMYHLHMQWSEYDRLTELERDWTIQRFIHQKKMEKEIMRQQQGRSAGGILIPEPSVGF